MGFERPRFIDSLAASSRYTSLQSLDRIPVDRPGEALPGHIRAEDLFKGQFVGTVGGTANAITLTPAPAVTAYYDGLELKFFPTAVNTSSVTINVSGLGAKNLRVGKRGLSAGAIAAGRPAHIVYDGTDFQLMNPVRWFLVDEYHAGDNDAAINAAIASARNAGGGIVLMGYATYGGDQDIVLGDSNEVGLAGMGPFASVIDLSGGGRLIVKGCFDFVLRDFAVQNGTADNIVLGAEAGTTTYCAYFSIQNVMTAGAADRGLAVENAYMGNLQNIRSFQSGGIGLDFGGGLNTSLAMSGVHALGGSSDGWRLRNMIYCAIDNAGSDQNAGYGYALQGLNAVQLHGGAENNGKAALHFHHDGSSGDVIDKFNGMLIDGFASVSNAQTVTANGELAHFTSAVAAQDAGQIEFRGLTARLQTQETFHIESGSYKIVCPWNRQTVAKTVKGGSFSAIVDTAGDVAKGLPVNITGPATPVATLRPKMCNGVQSLSGQILIHASKNNLASASKSALYNLLVIEYSGGTEIEVQGDVGAVAGAAADEASFTWSYSALTNELLATPVGSTGTGDWYLYFTVLGNIDLTPL